MDSTILLMKQLNLRIRVQQSLYFFQEGPHAADFALVASVSINALYRSK